jgi:hypothetical protein
MRTPPTRDGPQRAVLPVPVVVRVGRQAEISIGRREGPAAAEPGNLTALSACNEPSIAFDSLAEPRLDDAPPVPRDGSSRTPSRSASPQRTSEGASGKDSRATSLIRPYRRDRRYFTTGQLPAIQSRALPTPDALTGSIEQRNASKTPASSHYPYILIIYTKAYGTRVAA